MHRPEVIFVCDEPKGMTVRSDVPVDQNRWGRTLR